MQRILASTGRRSKLALGIELDDWTYYYAGDTVKGHLVLESPKSVKVSRVRMVWMGVVRVQLEPGIQDGQELFRQVYNVDLPAAAALEAQEETEESRRREAFRNAAVTTTAYGVMIPASNPSPVFSLEADKQYRFPFAFAVPSDVPLPSCTESETSTNSIVEYVIEAQVEQRSTDFAAPTKARINVPVLQEIDTLVDELDSPQSSQVYCHSEEDDNQDHFATLSATVPKKAFLRNQTVSVTVDLKHFTTFQRPNAVIIALIRVTRIICKGISYLLSDSVVHYVKADIDVTPDSGLTQTIVRSILIPGTITPTIDLNGQLLQVTYKVRVRAQFKETSYELPVVNFPSDFQSLAGMTVEIPITIGTLPVSPTHTPMSPISPRFVKPYEPSESLLLPDDASLDPDTESRANILRKILRRTSSAGSTQTLPIMNESNGSLTINTKKDRRASNVSLSLKNTGSMLIKTVTNAHDDHSTSTSSSSNNDASSADIGNNSNTTSSTSTTASIHNKQSPVVVVSPSSSTRSPPKIEDTYRFSVGPCLSTWFDQHYLSTETTHPPHEHINTTTSDNSSPTSPDNNNNDTPAPLFIQLSSSSNPSNAPSSPKENHVDPKQQDHNTPQVSSQPSVEPEHPSVISVPPLLKSQDPQRREKEDQERQMADHLEQSQLDQRHMDGNTYYFYIFDDSEDEDEEQVQSTPVGFLKPNSSTNNLAASEARISMDKPSTQAYQVSAFIDKPDQVTDSEEDSSDDDEDLLDIISRRDRRIASRMGGAQS